MHTRSVRKFNLLDAMVLVAATALGITWGWRELKWQWLNDEAIDHWGRMRALRQSHPILIPLFVAVESVEYALPALAAWTVSVFILALRNPRRPLRRLALSPGVSACAAGSLALILNVLDVCAIRPALELARGEGKYLLQWSIWIDRLWFALRESTRRSDRVAFAVLGVWTCLLLAKRFRCEPTWIDRAGRAIGFAWIFLAYAGWFRYVIASVIWPSDVGP
jgi:hypothetical protein